MQSVNMRYIYTLAASIFIMVMFTLPEIQAKEASILVSCTQTFFKAWHTEKKSDKKLKFLEKKLKQPPLQNFAGFTFHSRKQLSLTDTKPVKIKLPSKKEVVLQLEKVVRASKKNTIIINRKENGTQAQIKFEDRDIFIQAEGKADSKADYFSALQCPLWP